MNQPFRHPLNRKDFKLKLLNRNPIKLEYPSLINNKTICQYIDQNSTLGEQVLKLFHYSGNGSVQIIPVNLEIRTDDGVKSITVFVSTLSEKTSGYKKSINKRDADKVPDVVIDDDPRFNSPNSLDEINVKEETMTEKLKRFLNELYESL